MPLSYQEFQINPHPVFNNHQTEPIADDLKAKYERSADESTEQDPTTASPLSPITEETKQSVAQFESIKQQLSSS